MKRGNTLKPPRWIVHLAESTIELFSCQGLGFLLCHHWESPSIPPALAISNTPMPQARAAAQLFPGGWSGQPTPLQRNALPLSHLGVRARGTFSELEGQESCGSGRSGRPRALQSKALLAIPSWLYISDIYYLCSKKIGLRHNHLASL